MAYKGHNSGGVARHTEKRNTPGKINGSRSWKRALAREAKRDLKARGQLIPSNLTEQINAYVSR